MKILGTLIGHIKNVWLICGITILLLLGVEITSKILVFIRLQVANVEPESRIHADAFENTEWAAAYFEELNSLIARPGRLKWHPYVYWRGAPFKGKYTNIDEQGLRHTWNEKKNHSSSTKPLRVFMFGGSTLWGTGAEDDATIPSAVAKLLAKNDFKAIVTNFGSTGYVTTQEAIALLRELQRGNVPDLVVFYDGANDTFSTFQNKGVAGLPQNEANREREFNLLRPNMAPRLYKETLRTAVQNSATYQVVRSLVRRTTGNELPDGEPRPTTPASATQVGSEVARVYAWNVKFVANLGNLYGFKTVFYWQPVIFNKEMRSTYEQEVYNDIRGLEIFYRESTVRVKALLADFLGFHDISDIFKDDSKPYFIDPWHIAGSGDAIIARRMMQEIGPITQKLLAESQAEKRHQQHATVN